MPAQEEPPLSSHIWGNILIDPRTLPQPARNHFQQRSPWGSAHHQSTRIRAQDAPKPKAVHQADGKARGTGRELGVCLTNAVFLFCGPRLAGPVSKLSVDEALMTWSRGYSEKRNRRLSISGRGGHLPCWDPQPEPRYHPEGEESEGWRLQSSQDRQDLKDAWMPMWTVGS